MLKKQYSKTKPVCKVTFSLPADAVENPQEIKVLGDFNNWSWEDGLVMKKSKSEYSVSADLEAGRTYEFRYLINQAIWVNDHAADAYVPSPFHGIDNSVIMLEPVKIEKTSPEKPAKKAAKKENTPKSSAKKTATKDDLKKIEGIGPKIEQLLNAAEIRSFADLAKAKKATLKGILEAAGSRYKMHDPTTWTDQAKLAAKGDWEKLSKLQDELKGGRKA